MFIVDNALKARQAEKKPIRVGMIGAGFMGQGLTNQIENSVPGMRMAGVHQFRILRGAVQDASQPAGRHTALARQKAWPVVRIDVESDMPPWVLRWLQENMEAPEAVVLRREPPLGLGTLAAEWADRLAP